MTDVVKGWEVWETIAYSMYNFDFGGHSYSEAHLLVQEGKGRWVHGQANTLKFVENDYRLKEREHFIKVVTDPATGKRHFEDV